MKFSLLFLLLIPVISGAFDKDFTTVNDRVPLEFIMLFDSLKMEIKTPSEQLQMIGLCKELNENLGFLSREHIFFLMKSEVIKDVLEHKFEKVRQFDMTNLLIKRLEDDFEKKQRYLNRFSQWIWRSVLAELKYRQSLGLITDKSFTPRIFEGQKLQEALRFQRYQSYLFPWIDQMDSLEATEFNQLTKKISFVILRRLNERSLLFKRYASTAAGDTKTTLFNIPQKLLDLHPEEFKRMKKEAPELGLKEQSDKEKAEATQIMENITPEDLSPISDELSQELDKKIQDSKKSP